MPSLRSSWFIGGLAALITLVLLPAASSILPETIPHSWRGYLWLAWPAAVLLVGILLFTQRQAKCATEGLIDGSELERIASALADGVRQKWNAELEALELRRPEPLPLRWTPAKGSGSMVESYGELSTVVDDFYALDKRQMVILGDAGAGKTVLATLLTAGLLDKRSPGDPVPVMLSLSSWEPDEHLHSFVARRLSEDHLGLGYKMALRLVTGGHILLILDGLDELPNGSLRTALNGIDRAVGGSDPIVITSRKEQYYWAITSDGRKLSRAAVTEIMPVPASDIDAFLGAESPGWQPVIEHLQAEPDGPIATAMSSPLIVWMARTVYRENPDLNPDELLGFTDAATIERHLLDAFIDVRYRTEHAPRPVPDLARRRKPRYRSTDARKWLVFLASQSQVAETHDLRVTGSRDFAWWRLKDAMPQPVLWITIVILYTAVLGSLSTLARESPLDVISGWASGPPLVVILWLSRDHLFQLAEFERPPHFRDAAAAIIRSRSFKMIWAFGSSAWIIFIILSTFQPKYFLTVIINCPIWLIGISILAVLTLGAPGIDITPTMTPVRMLTEERVSHVKIAAGVTLFFVIENTAFNLSPGAPGKVPLGIVLVASPLIALLGLSLTAWFAFSVARIWFAIRGKLPLRLMRFLDDAHSRGVLRQAGAVYQFRHARVQETLAGR